VVKWVNQNPVERRVLEPGERVPDIQALNVACPKSEWGVDFNNNPRGPWQFQYLVLLLDPASMDRYRFPTSTTGGGICIRDLVDKVRWMRRYRGEHVYPVITLADKFMNTRFGGRQRPHFVVKRWMQLGGDKPVLEAPKPTIEVVAESSKTEPPLPGATIVAESSLAEQMNDEIPPFDGSPDINAPAPKAPTPSIPVLSSRLAAPKPHTTKRGVQKITGGRGR
jgi:hypothetical protein